MRITDVLKMVKIVTNVRLPLAPTCWSWLFNTKNIMACLQGREDWYECPHFILQPKDEKSLSKLSEKFKMDRL